MAEYTPRTFTKDGQTTVAEDLLEDYQLLWDGWTPGTELPEQRDQIMATLADVDELIQAALDFGPSTVPLASTTVVGKVRLATVTETEDAVAEDLAVTPVGLQAIVDALNIVDGVPSGGGGAVDSVNGDNGPDVVLDAADVGADAAGAAAAAQAFAVQRGNHTGQQPSSTISDWAEAVQDTVAAALSGTTGATVSYNDAAGTITITGLGDPETMRDVLGTTLMGVGVISVTVNDGADTITISSTATANSTDAQLRDRSTHTGNQSADTIVDGTTNKAYTAAEKTKLAGVAAGATANATDAQLRDRSTHTGSQTASTISDLATATITFTNKRITKRVSAQASTATLTVDTDSFDGAKVTALAANLTIANPTGAPTGFQPLIIRIKDNGTARTLTWGAQFRAIGVTLPATTVVSKTTYVGCQWNSDDSKWDVIAVAQEA